jgi:hypothetical protein
MTRHLVVLAAAFALSACSGQNGAPASTSAAADASQATSVDRQAPTAVTYSPFPLGVVLAQRFHVRSDRIYTTKSGAQRRRATLELLDGAPDATADSVSKQMASSGFRALTVKDKGDGITRLAFVKKGAGRTNVSISSQVGDKPSNPRAIGLIMFDWQLAPATASAAAASPDQGAPKDQAAAGG